MTASKLKVGIDVPWVTSWSGEEMLGVGPCASVDGELALLQAERPGQGKPQYSKNHLRRQRETVGRMLCPMCGAATAAGDRWIQTARYLQAGELRARGLGAELPPDVGDAARVLNAGAIAPSHLACAERALAHCPHLGADPDPTLKPFPERWVVLPLMIEATPPARPQYFLARPLSGAPRPTPVVTFLQLCGIVE